MGRDNDTRSQFLRRKRQISEARVLRKRQFLFERFDSCLELGKDLSNVRVGVAGKEPQMIGLV